MNILITKRFAKCARIFLWLCSAGRDINKNLQIVIPSESLRKTSTLFWRPFRLWHLRSSVLVPHKKLFQSYLALIFKIFNFCAKLNLTAFSNQTAKNTKFWRLLPELVDCNLRAKWFFFRREHRSLTLFCNWNEQDNWENDYVFNDFVLANYSREIRVSLTKNSEVDISCRFIPPDDIFGNTSVKPFVLFTSDVKQPRYITSVVENPSYCRRRITICLTV